MRITRIVVKRGRGEAERGPGAPLPSTLRSPFATIAGRAPQQARSRERVERILEASGALIGAHGVTELTMSSVAKRARIPIGSLYQYFPSKGALLHRLFQDRLHGYHLLAIKHARTANSRIKCARALRRLVIAVYQANRADPLMRDIWGGAQADREMRHIHLRDNEFYSRLFALMAQRGGTTLPSEKLLIRATVINEMFDATIRLAITVAPTKGMALVRDSVDIALRELGLTSARFRRAQRVRLGGES